MKKKKQVTDLKMIEGKFRSNLKKNIFFVVVRVHYQQTKFET